MNSVPYVVNYFKNLTDQEKYYSKKTNQFNSRHWLGVDHKASNVSLFDYHFNSHRFHGSEFYENPDILALGCSITAGQGLPHEFTWPRIIESYAQSSVNVCAFSGSSIQKIWHNALANISFFGKPKSIKFLIPNIERIMYPSGYEDGWKDLDYIHDVKSFVHNGVKPFYGKSYDGKDFTIPFESSIEQFCLSVTQMGYFSHIMGVDFSVSSWNKPTIDILNEVKNESDFLSNIVLELYKGFLNVERKVFIPNCEGDECKFNAIPVTGLAKELWDQADDRPDGHPGLHAHLHWAEFMGDLILDEEFILSIKIGER